MIDSQSSFSDAKETGGVYFLAGILKSGKVRNIITMVGAGISTSAGIPDFRSPDTGLYTQTKKFNLPYAQALFEKKYFDRHPEPLFGVIKEAMLGNYVPTKSHYFIKLLEKKNILLRHFTQNIDGLERLAGLAEDKLVEAHGTVYSSHCTKCDEVYDLPWLKSALEEQNTPKCTNCLGLVRPDIVLYGESLPEAYTKKMFEDLPKCDLLIVMGSSLVVEPFASMVRAVKPNCPRVIINDHPVGSHLGIKYEENNKKIKSKKQAESKEKNECFLRDIFIQGNCDQKVEEIVELMEWGKDFEDVMQQ